MLHLRPFDLQNTKKQTNPKTLHLSYVFSLLFFVFKRRAQVSFTHLPTHKDGLGREGGRKWGRKAGRAAGVGAKARGPGLRTPVLPKGWSLRNFIEVRVSEENRWGTGWFPSSCTFITDLVLTLESEPNTGIH